MTDTAYLYVAEYRKRYVIKPDVKCNDCSRPLEIGTAVWLGDGELVCPECMHGSYEEKKARQRLYRHAVKPIVLADGGSVTPSQ